MLQLRMYSRAASPTGHLSAPPVSPALNFVGSQLVLPLLSQAWNEIGLMCEVQGASLQPPLQPGWVSAARAVSAASDAMWIG